MYEHPYLSYRVSELDAEQLERAVERRRFLAEHSDQIIRRPESAWRRMLRRIVRGPVAPAATPASVGRRATPPCEPATAR